MKAVHLEEDVYKRLGGTADDETTKTMMMMTMTMGQGSDTMYIELGMSYVNQTKDVDSW